MKKPAVFLFLFLTLGGCVFQTTAPLEEPIDSPEPIATEVPSVSAPPPTPIQTESILPINFSALFPPGEYLVFLGGSSQNHIFSLYDTDGNPVGSVPLYEYGGTPSHDLMYLAAFPYIIDLETGEKLSVPGGLDCVGPDWLYDNRRIIATCKNPEGSSDLYLLSLVDFSATRLSTCGIQDHDCSDVSISPDGKWIAYYFTMMRSGSWAQNGLHLASTECFSTPFSCTPEEPGMHVLYPYTWSPDSEFLAGVDADTGQAIDIFHVLDDARLVLSKKIEIGSDIGNLAWSPRGDWIAAGVFDGTILGSPETGSLKLLNGVRFLFWIEIP